MNELPERLPSRPLRNWFLAWHIHTGDPADVIAQGFDLDPVLVRDLLSGEVPLLMPATEAHAVASRCQLDPADIWPRGKASGRTVRGDLPEALVAALIGNLARWPTDRQ